MSNLTRLVTLAILVLALAVIGLVITQSTRPAESQEAALPSVFTVGANVQLDFGGSTWRIDEIQGEWLRVTDVSSEPLYSGVYWIHGVTGRIWAVRAVQ
jgi:hypothetical protein